jgi:hypothetical protein
MRVKQAGGMKHLLVSCMLLLGLAGLAWGEEDPGTNPKADVFRELDAEAESLLLRVLDMGAEMAIVEEQRVRPEQTQLMVVFSLEPGLAYTPGRVELRIDGQTIASQHYSAQQLQALRQGGAHRLYWENVPAGRHELSAQLLEDKPSDGSGKPPKVQRQAAMMFVSGIGRRVMEVSLSHHPDPKQTIPQMAIKEWK